MSITTSNTSSITAYAELIGDHCPVCKSTEAWHGCIVEDDSRTFACDECGASMSVSRAAAAQTVAIATVDPEAPAPKPARRPKTSPIGTQLIRGINRLLDDIEDDAAAEKAYADFGMHILTLLARGPSEDVTIDHLEAAAKALGMKPSELLVEATS